MIVATALALALLPGSVQAADSQAPAVQETVLATYKLAGADVAAKIPTPKALPLAGSSSVKWDGWTYLFAEKGNLLGRVKATGGWDDVKDLYEEAKPKIVEATPVLRLKAFILTRIDVLERSPQGVLRQRRATLEPSMVARSLESFARTCAVAEAYGGGRYKVVPDVQVENDTLYFGPNGPGFTDAFAQWFLGPRINGGEFDAEDKVYRGPYDSVLFIHPGTPGDGQPTCTVNGMPVTGIAYNPKEDGTPGVDLAGSELAAWFGHIARSLQRWEIPSDAVLSPTGVGEGAYVASPESLLLGSVWASVGSRTVPPLDARLSALERRGKPSPSEWAQVAADPWVKLPWLKPSDLATYAGKTDLLDLGKPGVYRRFAWAKPGDESAPADPVTALDDALISGRESMALVSSDTRKLLLVTGGVAPFVGVHLKPALDAKAIGAMVWGTERFVVFEIAQTADPKSEADLLDLAATPPVAHTPGSDYLAPATFALNYGTAAPYALPEGVTADAASPVPESRALAAAGLEEASSPAQRAAVVALLPAREDYVKLNAAQAFTRVKDANAEPALILLTNSFNTRVAEAALKALAFQGTEPAWAAVRRAMNYGRYDRSRQVATELIAELNDPKMSPVISIMMTSRSWQGRLAAVEAIGRQKDLVSQRIMVAFLNEIDPAVRLAVIKLANTELEPIAHNLLWPAVNDPSDLVRSWSYIGLIRSAKEEDRKEGYKGVRDDSVTVRLAVLEALAAKPDEAHRNALRLAVTDSSAIVRAKALAGFAKLPGEVALAEVQNVLDDKEPVVQSALVTLAKAKSLKLSATALASLRSSADPSVAAAARELPE